MTRYLRATLTDDGARGRNAEPTERGPLIERIGLAAIASVMAVMFGGVG